MDRTDSDLVREGGWCAKVDGAGQGIPEVTGGLTAPGYLYRDEIDSQLARPVPKLGRL